MSLLIFHAYLELISFEIYLARGNFQMLYSSVRDYPLRNTSISDEAIPRICAAVDMACIWYWKQVLCLQRSVVTARLLKAHGVPAHMFIGAQQMPFRAHAWVEVAGRVINDKPYIRELYAVIDHC